MRHFKIETKIQAARDYHFSGLSIKEIAEKYDCGENTPTRWAQIYPKEDFLIEDNEEECVIIVKKKNYAAALLSLEFQNVPYEKPDNIIIEQQYESKINRKRLPDH